MQALPPHEKGLPYAEWQSKWKQLTNRTTERWIQDTDSTKIRSANLVLWKIFIEVLNQGYERHILLFISSHITPKLEQYNLTITVLPQQHQRAASSTDIQLMQEGHMPAVRTTTTPWGVSNKTKQEDATNIASGTKDNWHVSTWRGNESRSSSSSSSQWWQTTWNGTTWQNEEEQWKSGSWKDQKPEPVYFITLGDRLILRMTGGSNIRHGASGRNQSIADIRNRISGVQMAIREALPVDIVRRIQNTINTFPSHSLEDLSTGE